MANPSDKCSNSNTGSQSSTKSKSNSHRPIEAQTSIPNKDNFGGLPNDDGEDDDSENNPKRIACDKTIDGETADDSSEEEEDDSYTSGHGLSGNINPTSAPNVGRIIN